VQKLFKPSWVEGQKGGELLPEKCQQCTKSKRTTVRTACRICADTDFEWAVLCELHRKVQQKADEFECGAFTPVLSVAGSKNKKASPEAAQGLRANPLATQLAVAKLMNSDKMKYQTALALQKLTEDPDAIIVDLKFHFAWSVHGRRSIFRDLEKYSGILSEVLATAAIPSVKRAGLLWLAPDHVHVYCDSDGEKSPEDILIGLKQILARGIIEKCPEVFSDFVGDREIWETGYFVETLDSF
jgi:REP element-mobilizing transposase RayT